MTVLVISCAGLDGWSKKKRELTEWSDYSSECFTVKLKGNVRNETDSEESKIIMFPFAESLYFELKHTFWLQMGETMSVNTYYTVNLY